MSDRVQTSKYQHNPENKFFYIVGLLVFLTSFPVLSSLLSDSHLQQDIYASAAGREPASTEPSAIDRNQSWNKAKNSTLEISCKSLLTESQVLASHLRLLGQNCNWEKIRVKNLRNGYTASVVVMDSARFTTDFIELSDGTNQIEISAIDSKGSEIINTVHIERL